MTSAPDLIDRLDRLMAQLERLLPPADTPIDWSAPAFRWRRDAFGRGWLQPVRAPQRLALADLCCLERQTAEIERNTRQFLAGGGANNVLLWGARGTGKSSLVKAVFNAHRDAGLRLIEIDRDELVALPDILDLIRDRPERFILFCDDLSFEAGESGYTALKAVLEGSIAATPENLLIYATSNRRHLLPEYQADNRDPRIQDGELHHGEAVEEKISLSDRFGLWISFHPFSQAQYLEVVRHWVSRLAPTETPRTASDWAPIEQAALQWALRRGSRGGRTAWQFARDWAGRDLITGAPGSGP
ncbi:MAG: ATP-binding protein [Thermochromatium sp.]